MYIGGPPRTSPSRPAILSTDRPRLLLRDHRMDDTLYFTEHHHQVREMVREFSGERIAPVAAELRRQQAQS